MQPDKSRPDKPRREKDGKPDSAEFEVAYYTKELGRPLQRKLLQQQMEASGLASTCAHGEDPSPESPAGPPRHDRAG